MIPGPLAAFERFFRENGDKRVANLRFMDSPWEVIGISMFYVYFCYDLGPKRLMKNRQAFNLVWTVRIFNTLILLLNVWLLKKFFSMSNYGLDTLGCAPVNENDTNPKALEFIRIAPGGSSVMFPIVNGMVHTIMYSYYILSTFDAVKPYLWWKKYVTRIQLVQFIILGVHFAAAALTPGCKYPRILSLSGLAIAGMFFALFIAFYRDTYLKEQKERKQQQLKHQSTIHEQQRPLKSLDEINSKNNNNNNFNSISNNNNNNNTIYNHNHYEDEQSLLEAKRRR